MRLMREIRFSLVPSDGRGNSQANSWAGRLASDAVCPFIVLRATVEGQVDSKTGFLCNVTQVDRMLREHAVEALSSACDRAGAGCLSGCRAIRTCWSVIVDRCPPGTTLVSLEMELTPYVKFEIRSGDDKMVHMTESFEFAASHRLCCPGLSDRENREAFGKCNNPHGHNYTLEVTIRGEPRKPQGTLVDLPVFERVVMGRVIDRLDHKHLNQDCEEFRTLNPSMENIARVIWSLLDGEFAPAELESVRVWETPKTYAEYRGN